ncbi:hypothetical protein pb186bvf_014275 [Paramecium bursaria]
MLVLKSRFQITSIKLEFIYQRMKNFLQFQLIKSILNQFYKKQNTYSLLFINQFDANNQNKKLNILLLTMLNGNQFFLSLSQFYLPSQTPLTTYQNVKDENDQQFLYLKEPPQQIIRQYIYNFKQYQNDLDLFIILQIFLFKLLQLKCMQKSLQRAEILQIYADHTDHMRDIYMTFIKYTKYD